MGKLGEFDLGHVHQGIYLIFGSLEVLDAEGVDGDMGNSRLVANF